MQLEYNWEDTKKWMLEVLACNALQVSASNIFKASFFHTLKIVKEENILNFCMVISKNINHLIGNEEVIEVFE